MELVEVKENEVYCSSYTVAKKFGLKHAVVVGRIKNVQKDLEGLRVHGVYPKCNIEEREYRGRVFDSYIMNRDFFSFLVMRFRRRKAIEWQLRFIAAFNAMEAKLIQFQKNASDQEWIGKREESKLIRHEETDTIKEFVEYATSQGSKSARFYYKHITTATYRALGLMAQKNPKLRDSMNIVETSQLLLAERHATRRLRKYMELGRHYKDIYSSVKKDLIGFGEVLRLE